MASFYQGTEVGTLLKSVKGSRFFYGLRRTDEGDLYLVKSDQLKATDGVQLNRPGDPEQNYPDFQRGIEFFEGRDEEHNTLYTNLRYEQFRWDDRNLIYYVDDEGNLIVRINQNYDFPDGVSP